MWNINKFLKDTYGVYPRGTVYSNNTTLKAWTYLETHEPQVHDVEDDFEFDHPYMFCHIMDTCIL